MVKKRILSITYLNLKIVNELFTNKKGITIKKLAENIKTDYKNTYNAVDFLFKSGIIKKEKLGNYNVCELNYDNKREVARYLKWHNFVIKINDFKRKHSVEYQIITDTIDNLKDKITHFFICLVFGSYAKNEEKKNSDIDVLFLTSISGAEIIKNVLNKINAPYQKKFHISEQNVGEFMKDLKDKDKLSIAREIFNELPIVFYGEDIFFDLILGSNGNNE